MCRWCMIALYYTVELTNVQATTLLDSGAPLANDERRYLNKVASTNGGAKRVMVPPKAADKLANWKAYAARGEEAQVH